MIGSKEMIHPGPSSIGGRVSGVLETHPTTHPGDTGGVAEKFTDLVTTLIGDPAQEIRHAEKLAIGVMKGTASTQDAVFQLAAAEHALSATIALRDKAVSAYLEITRMTI